MIYNFNNYSDINNIINNYEDELNFTSEKNGSKFNLKIGPIDKKQLNNLVSYFIAKGYKETKILIN